MMRMRKKLRFVSVKIFFILCLFFSKGTFAQLDTIHWIPSLHFRANTEIQDHYLYLSTPIASSFVVTIRNGSGTILATPTISNSSPFVYQIGNGQLAGSPSFVPIDSLNKPLKNSGLIISAPKVFYANLRARSASQSDCLTAKGRAAAGTEFRIGGFPQVVDNWLTGNRNFTVGFIATVNNTTVTVSGYKSGVVFADPISPFSSPTLTFTLNQGECYVISGYTNISANLDGSMGALVQSNNPIVINNGNLLGNIANNSTAQDMGFDQTVPTTKIGNNYILIEGLGNANMERPIVIAHSNNTDIFINGSTTPVTTLGAGQYYVVPNSFYQGIPHRNMYIHTSQPAYVYQALAGSSSEATGGLNFIPPFSCFLKDTIDMIPSVNMIGSTSYSGNIFVFTHQGATLQLNGVVQTGAVAVTGAPWETYRLANVTGHAKITSTHGVAAGIFGASGNAGYAGYYAGFSDLPTINAGNDTIVCAGTSVSLNVTSSITGGTYSWTPATGLSNPNISNPVANPATTTSYTVTITSPKGCIATDSVKVTVASTLTVTVSTQSVSCFGDNDGSASVSVSGGSGIYTYLWNTSPIQTTSTATGLAAGNYTVIVMDTSTICGINIQAISITQPTAISPSITATNVSCNGGNDGTASVSVSGGTSPYSYLWNNAATTSQISNLISQNYSVIITDANGCTSTASVTITQPQPVQVSIFGNTTLCLGDTTTLSANGGISYSWSTGATTSSVILIPSSTSTYFVIATDANGCTGISSISVTVNPLPSVTITGDTAICTGSSTILTASGGINYLWNTGATTSSVNVSPTASSIYTVLVIDANGCSNTGTTTVTVNPLPVATITGNSPICSGDSAMLTASGGINYSWSTMQTTSSIFSILTSTTTFSVTVTDVNGCTGSASHTIIVNPLPNISISGNLTVCQGDVITLAASGGNNYVWSNGSGSAVITTTVSGTYSVIGTDTNGCTNTASAATNVLPPPIASISGNNIICQGDTAVLTANGGLNYLWTTGSSSSSITVSNAGTYLVIVSIGSCSDTASVTVTVNPLPNANAGNDITIPLGTTVILNGTGSGNTFNWSPSWGLSCTNCANPTASPSVTTTYTLTVADTNGCVAWDEVTIIVDPPICGELFIPNAFSPNGDEPNQYFRLYGKKECIESFHICIFNRWGEKVFESHDATFRWDGMYRGNKLNASVFIYYYDIKTIYGTQIHRQGNISLIR